MIATRTILVCCVTWLGAGCGLAGYVNKIMTKCLDKLYLTYGTDLRVFAIGLCTGSMTECRNGFLSYKDFLTLATNLTFGKTAFGTGCILGGKNS